MKRRWQTWEGIMGSENDMTVSSLFAQYILGLMLEKPTTWKYQGELWGGEEPQQKPVLFHPGTRKGAVQQDRELTGNNCFTIAKHHGTK